jgi:pimeloyl-ACP methyl ester carboxylesterase
VLERLAPGTRSRRVRWSQGKTRMLELGEGAGPPLVLVHGAFDNAALWAPILAELATGRRVVAVDLPGHGLADSFDYEAADLAELSVRFLGDVLDRLELGRVDLAGCSLGGFVTTTFALHAPERVGRLVLVGAPVGVTRDVPTPLRALGALVKIPLAGRPLGRLVLARPTREKMRTLMGRIAVAHPEELDDEMLDADVLCQIRNRDVHLGILRSLGTWRGMRLRPELVLGERWQDLTVPTVFLRGERDVFVSQSVADAWAEIVERNPRIRIVPVADAGHLAWLDAPDEVVRGIAVPV